MKKIVADGIGVDAGMIMVGCCSYLDEVPKRDEPEYIVELDNGVYNVKWVIPDTWNGRISGTADIKISSGRLFISDPCYVIGAEHDDWMAWLNATSYGEAIPSDKVFVIDEMGGDGCYTVQLRMMS